MVKKKSKKRFFNEKHINVRISDKYYNAIRRIAGPHGKISSVLREAVTKYVDSKESIAA